MKHIYLLLSILFVFCVLRAETTTSPNYAGGNGTLDNPYKIISLAQLRLLSETSDDWSKSFILTADIDASDTKNWNEREGFSPIGKKNLPFTGTFNGGGYTINHLHIYKTGRCKGMFGFINSAHIEQLGLINCVMVVGDCSGCLVGMASGISVIQECYSTGYLSAAGTGSGGIVGCLDSSMIRMCYSNGTISGYLNVGGIVGQVMENSKVENCFSNSNVSGICIVGGIVGSALTNADVQNCMVGGMVKGGTVRGGIAGQIRSGSIKNCYVAGFVEHNGLANIGILVGLNDATITGCYYDVTVNPKFAVNNNAQGSTHITPLKTSDFSDAANFFSFDFDSTWKIFALSIVDDVNRPYLQWLEQCIPAKKIK